MTLRLYTFALSTAILLPAASVDFARDVQPILIAKCGACHGGDKRSGGFTIREYSELLHGGRSGGPILPGDAKSSLLWQRITGEREPTMPLGGPPLNPADLATIRNWIDEGARLTPDSEPAKPQWRPKLTLDPPHTSTNDALHRYFAQHHIAPPPPVSDPVFLRRAYLDLWGLLPSPEDLDRFVADPDPHKREKLIDCLLADNAKYAGHWISFWNDLLRNDGGDQYHGGRKSITDWLYRALATNLPYNAFVSQLLNPDSPGSPDGFLLGVNWRGDVNASQTPVMQAAQNSAQVFLGINLKCNSCHDSFISRWKLKDAYSLAAFFAETPKLELVRCDNPTGQFVTAAFLYPELGQPTEGLSLNMRHEAVAKMFTDPRNGRTPRTVVNRYWQKLLGRGIVLDVDDMDGEPWDAELLDALAADFAAHGYDLKHLLRTIMTSDAYQLPAVHRPKLDDKAYVFRGPEVRRMTAEQFVDAIGALTGEWQIAEQPGATTAIYSRDWRVPSSELTRALGRPIRDQVYTERDESATTLQALELVNGAFLEHMIDRGAARLLGKLPNPPENIFDSGKLSSGHIYVDIPLNGLDELHLISADWGSYSPERVLPVWAEAIVEKDGVWQPLSAELAAPVQMRGAAFADGIRTRLHSDTVIDLRGKSFTRLRAVVGLEEKCLQNDISPSVRFFAFGVKPDWDHLVKVEASADQRSLRPGLGSNDLIPRLWKQALGRNPNPQERKLAESNTLADVLWSLLMLPEFQLIQ